MNKLDKTIIKLVSFYIAFNESEKIIRPIFSKKCLRCVIIYLSGEEVLNAVSKLSPEEMNFYIFNKCSLLDKASPLIDDFLYWAISSDDFKSDCHPMRI